MVRYLIPCRQSPMERSCDDTSFGLDLCGFGGRRNRDVLARKVYRRRERCIRTLTSGKRSSSWLAESGSSAGAPSDLSTGPPPWQNAGGSHRLSSALSSSDSARPHRSWPYPSVPRLVDTRRCRSAMRMVRTSAILRWCSASWHSFVRFESNGRSAVLPYRCWRRQASLRGSHSSISMAFRDGWARRCSCCS